MPACRGLHANLASVSIQFYSLRQLPFFGLNTGRLMTKNKNGQAKKQTNKQKPKLEHTLSVAACVLIR